MLDIGWSELMVVGLVALIIIGPKDLPKVMRTFGRYVGKVQGMAREFQSSMEDMARESELADAKKALDRATNFNIQQEIKDSIDPTRAIESEFDVSDIEDALDEAATGEPAKRGVATDGTKGAGEQTVPGSTASGAAAHHNGASATSPAAPPASPSASAPASPPAAKADAVEPPVPAVKKPRTRRKAVASTGETASGESNAKS